MFAETSNHTPAMFQENTGFRLNGFPVLGSWLSYGLGCETDNLPAFVVIPDARELPAGGSINWTNAFCRLGNQGVVVRASGNPIDDLFPPDSINATAERATRDLLASMNARHLTERQMADPLAARVQAYEMAARMQLAVPEVADLGSETAATQSMYGFDRAETTDFARACLMARRLLERGVRDRAAFLGRNVWQSAPELGRPRRHDKESRARGLADRSARGGAIEKICDSAACSRIRSCCLPPSSAAHPSRNPRRRRGQGTRPQSVRLHRVDGRSRAEARAQLMAPPTTSAIARLIGRYTGTIFTRPSCTCWASITSG